MTRFSYQDFWALRGTSAFWLTTHLGYGPGAVIALLSSRLRLTPNVVSVLSFAVVWVALVPLFCSFWSTLAQGLWLALFLLVSFWFDCADGVLARATGTASTYGAVLDKTMDMASAVLFGSVIGVMALGVQSWWIPKQWQLFILPLSLVPRAALTALNWLKDALLHGIDRQRRFIAPITVFGRAKRIVGNLFDDVTLRVGAGVSWAFGCYWEFALVAHSVLLLMLIGYLWASKRDMDVFDQRQNK